MSAHEHEHEHEHNHNHIHSHNEAEGNILTAFILNLVFVIIELIGGFFTNSIAILTDAIHDAGDCVSVGCAYFMQRLSGKRANAVYTYGYGRYSVLSALINAVILIAGSCVAVTVSVQRIFAPEPVNGKFMIALAAVGIIINGAAVLKTHHGHGLNERVISLHMLEDVLGWFAVFIGSIFLVIFELPVIDPILSVFVALYVLYHAVRSLIPVISVLLEKLPDGFDTDGYRHALCDIEGVRNAHHIHVWTIDGEDMLATLHLLIDAGVTAAEYARIRREAERISALHDIGHVTVQLCREGEDCDGECDKCAVK